jgi:hypothetical protein
MLILTNSDASAQSFELPLGNKGWTSNCDFCLASQGISPLEVGSSGIRIDLRYLRLSTSYLNGSRTSNEREELESHFTQQYSFFYALAPRFSVSAIVPVPKRHSEELGENGNMVVGNQFGVGDLSLLLRYKPVVDHGMTSTTIFSLTAGLKLPTGRTDGKDSEGNLLDAHVQLGTGSTDVLAGASTFVAWERTALIANLLAGITTAGANGHQFGNSLNYDLTVRYKIYPAEYDETQLFMTLGVNGELRGREIQDGMSDPNTGGNVTYVSPGLQFFVSSAVSVEAIFQYPFLHALHGEQLGEDFKIVTGIQLLL